MKVKDRLSLQFSFMFAVLLIAVLAGIYWFVEHNRVKNFYNKLNDRALTVAQFYLAEDNLSKENFKEVLKKFPQTLSEESIRIYDDQYKPKFIPEGSVHWKKIFLKQVTAQKRVMFAHGKTQVTGIYYADNSGNFIIVVSATDVEGYKDMHDLAFIMFFFFLASLIITFLMGRIFARISLIPIISITKNLKKIRSTSLDLRLNVNKKKTDEIDILSVAINNLLEHLEQSFENQKAFISNASHELRTPITSILGEAETTLSIERDKEEYQLTLAGIIKDAERLEYIINSLMDLVRTNLDNNDFQKIRMNELLWAAADELTAKDKSNEINLSFNLPADPSKFTLQGNHQLLFIAVSNILKNALKFSNNKPVDCEIYCEAGNVCIVVRDQGIGINQQDQSKIFLPFYRSVNALIYPGYGVGLSLTQNIMRLHNGSIQVKSELEKGTEFRLIFPIM
jgi:signal transduction histidine kinase